MKILAVETSASVASAAICEEDKLICEMVLNHKKTHSETLMPMIDGLFKSCELSVSDIDVFAAASGPGSFTGLRIGVCAVKGLAHGVNKPVVGVNTLEALSYNLPYADGLICPIMDARRSQVYNGIYRFQKGFPETITAPRAIALSDCMDELKGESRVYFVGDGVPVYREEIKRVMGERAVFAPLSCNAQRASCVAAAAMRYAKEGKIMHYSELLPVYLRKPQAERELEEKQKGDL